MLAVVKTPLTSIEIKGFIPSNLMMILKQEYGKFLKIAEEKSESVDYFSSKIHREASTERTLGFNLKTYRENKNLTQTQLGELVGVSNRYICDLEKSRREISKDLAKKFAEIFETSVERFI